MQIAGIRNFQGIGLSRRLRTLRGQGIKYFTIAPQTTPETLKKRDKALCNKFHPDKGGDHTQINVEYRRALMLLKENVSNK